MPYPLTSSLCNLNAYCESSHFTKSGSLSCTRGRVGVGVLNALFSFSGVGIFHSHLVVQSVFAIASSAANSLTSAARAVQFVQRRTHASQPLHWRHQPSIPPCKNANSADSSPKSAYQFGGKSANCAICAAIKRGLKICIFSASLRLNPVSRRQRPFRRFGYTQLRQMIQRRH